ncbi:MAG TPA: undecaprenyl-phosphate glucose phosphotransferase [Bacteroidetes bacterium]|nr:undecaprenyl-phosphate glucose phosphotransferase [Ignavibacteria bacterium]HCA42605.1 undecaprenyl-phosphate glucose phosphotransferase [Bacteroidota bacterium]
MSSVKKVDFYIPLLTVLLDFSAILLAFYFAFEFRFYSFFESYIEATKGFPKFSSYMIFGLISLPVWFYVFQARKMYRLNRNVFIFDEFIQIIKCSTISIIVIMAAIFFYRSFEFSRVTFVFIWIFSIGLITIFRYFVIKFEQYLYNKEIGVKNVAVVGKNEMAVKIYDKFLKDKFAGFRVVGYFANSIENNTGFQNKKHLGGYDSIPEKIKELKIEKLLISLSANDHDDIYDLMKICEGINVEFMMAPDYIDIITSKLRVEEVDGIPFMKLKSLPLSVWNKIVKRAFDIFVSSLVLILTLPVMIVISILIKLTSKGPLLYKQERVGLDGEKFMMYKFRSMRIDAEQEGPKMTTKGDNRYTPIGKTLRKFSLDELPQFFNVLKGDMSIVGPRPEREYFINILKDSFKNYLERHRVKCGITGWAQVNGLRGSNTPLQTRIDYDIYYIENWSLAFDIKIIFKTFKEMLFSKDAF